MSENNKPKFRFNIPGVSFRITRVGRLRAPSVTGMKLPLPSNLHMGGGKIVVLSLSTVILGFLAGMFVMINTGDQALTFPMTGAEYTAPSQVGLRVVDSETPAEQRQTLKINLPAGIRLDPISLSNISLGKAGLTTAFQINGTSTAYIFIDDLIIRNSEFPSMDVANSQIYKINATSSVVTAGHTFEMTATSTISDISIGSARGAASYVADNMVVDRIIIESSGVGEVIIDTLVIDNVATTIGNLDIDYVKVGTMTMQNLRVGDDGDINSADMVFHDSVYYTVVNDSIQEGPVNIK